MKDTIWIILALVLMWCALYGLYALSKNQQKMIATSRLKMQVQQKIKHKYWCFIALFIAMLCLMMAYGVSVGFVALYLLIMPISLIIIFSVNKLKR